MAKAKPEDYWLAKTNGDPVAYGEMTASKMVASIVNDYGEHNYARFMEALIRILLQQSTGAV